MYQNGQIFYYKLQAYSVRVRYLHKHIQFSYSVRWEQSSLKALIIRPQIQEGSCVFEGEPISTVPTSDIRALELPEISPFQF